MPDLWRRWSLRARTTAAATAALVPVLVVAGVAGVLVQRADLTSGVAALAVEQARTLAADAPEAGQGPVAGSEESIVQVVSLDTGAVLDGSTDAGSTALVPAPPGSGVVHTRITDPVPDEPDRYEAVALRSADGATYVVVARSLESVDAATASTSALLSIGGVVVLIATGLLTWRTTGRALAPVEAMRKRAASLSSDDLTSRLPVPPTSDELARLATTLNDLLARLDASAVKERRFVADASHELRSPVATIRALVESDRLSPHPGGHAGLSDEVLVETDRLTALVDDLLRLARGDAQQARPHGPVDLTAVLLSEARRARTLAVDASVEPGLVVDGDADALAVAVRNLLDNAERYAASRVSLAASRSDSRIVVTVSDDGPGIPPADRERVFERFVRLDDSRSHAAGGTGLGLAIVRQVVEAHHGTVRIAGASPGARVEVSFLESPDIR